MRMTPFRAALAAFPVVALGACKKADVAPPKAPRAQIIQFVPTLLGSTLTDTTGTDDAERRTFVIGVPLDSVRKFYQGMLPNLGWGINSNLGDSATYDIYARRGSQALWVHVKRMEPSRSEYTLIANVGGAPPVQGDTAK